MKNFRKSLFYISIIGVFTALIYFVISKAAVIEAGRNIVRKQIIGNPWIDFLSSMSTNVKHPLAILLAQIVIIILVARLFGWIFRKIGQPSVIGEMIAGIVLGPSLVGLYFPAFSLALFPVASLGNLQFLSQIGLILFMFVIGMELDLKVLKNKAHDAVVISHASIIIPFSLGLSLSYFIYHQFAPAGVEFVSFGLFMGIAMSITAFPVLARIVQERGLQKTKLGTIAITCAAADDITAWCILAVVIAIVKAGSFVSALYVIGLAVLYVLMMLIVVRPFLKRVGDLNVTRESLNKPVVAIFFLVLLMSSFISEVIGIHALFGAFLAGAIMPENNKFRNIFIEKVEDVAIIILLPLFFVFTGLRTQIGLLNDPHLWKITGLIIGVAVVGKFLGSALAAKFVGQNWKDSLAIGALMNTRGLMELVVLNIGYDLGVLTTEIFTMMVIMALVTTLMTGPALDFIGFVFKNKLNSIPNEISDKSKYKVLFSYVSPDQGEKLLLIANSLVSKQVENAKVTGLHLSLSSEIHSFDIKNYEQKMILPVIQASERLDQKLESVFKMTGDLETQLLEINGQGNYDLLLIAMGESIFQGTLLGKILGFTSRIVNPDRLINTFTGKEGIFENSPFDERTRQILTKSKNSVGILIDKNLEQMDQIFIPVFSKDDYFLVDYAKKFISNNNSQIILLDATNEIKKNRDIQELIRSIEQIAPNHIMIIQEKIIKKEFLQTQDLMLIGLDSWKSLIETQSTWLNNIPSVLIMKE